MSQAQRRAEAETKFAHRLANQRYDAAEAEVIRLREMVREALDDKNPWERLWPRHLELKQALSDYQYCSQRLSETTARL